MAESDTAVANRALQMLGSRRISSLGQDSPNARSMNVAFMPVRDALLRAHPWNFAISRASVAADPVQTAYEGLNRYLKPNDFLALVRDKFTAVRNDRQDWVVEGKHIVTTDSSPLQFRYIRRVEDPKEFDPLFDELLAARLALETVDDITDSNTKEQTLIDLVATKLLAAKSANAFENDSDDPPEDPWVAVMR